MSMIVWNVSPEHIKMKGISVLQDKFDIKFLLIFSTCEQLKNTWDSSMKFLKGAHFNEQLTLFFKS